MDTPLIIEFYGLPGSGKTTIVNALQRRLEGMGLTTVIMYYRNILHRKPQTLLAAPSYWKIIKTASSCAKMLSKHRYMERILLMVRFVRMYRHFSMDTPADCLLIDQGIFQGLLSIAHDEVMPRTETLHNLIKLLHLDELRLFLVKCDVSVDTANERIISRQSNGCRVEAMTEAERRNTLIVQTSNITNIRTLINEECPSLCMVEINSEGSVDDAVDIILNTISLKK